MIDVKKKDGQEFMVKVEEEGTSRAYNVTLDEGYYQELTRGKITKEELIKKSFEFLLEREPKESMELHPSNPTRNLASTICKYDMLSQSLSD